MELAPSGADAHSGVYHVDTEGGGRYFLKTRALGAFDPASLLVPAYLAELGVAQALAPLPALDGARWREADGLALSLWPLVEGRQGADGGLSEAQWRELGHVVRRVHETAVPWHLGVPQEAFVPSRWGVLEELHSALAAPVDPLAADLAEIWNAYQAEIDALMERVRTLGARLRHGSGARVLCHADLHLWNVMVEPDGRIWLVDWDETTLALKERDLMFVIGGIGHGLVGPQETDWFLEGYGGADIDPDALAYYRAAWAVQDIAAYGEQVCLAPGLSEEARREELAGFASLFAPGNIVEIALQ